MTFGDEETYWPEDPSAPISERRFWQECVLASLSAGQQANSAMDEADQLLEGLRVREPRADHGDDA